MRPIVLEDVRLCDVCFEDKEIYHPLQSDGIEMLAHSRLFSLGGGCSKCLVGLRHRPRRIGLCPFGAFLSGANSEAGRGSMT